MKKSLQETERQIDELRKEIQNLKERGQSFERRVCHVDLSKRNRVERYVHKKQCFLIHREYHKRENPDLPF